MWQDRQSRRVPNFKNKNKYISLKIKDDTLLKFETLSLCFILFIEIVFLTPVLFKNTMPFRGLFLYLPHTPVYCYGVCTG
jgi:hypothetical protein